MTLIGRKRLRLGLALWLIACVMIAGLVATRWKSCWITTGVGSHPVNLIFERGVLYFDIDGRHISDKLFNWPDIHLGNLESAEILWFLPSDSGSMVLSPGQRQWSFQRLVWTCYDSQHIDVGLTSPGSGIRQPYGMFCASVVLWPVVICTFALGAVTLGFSRRARVRAGRGGCGACGYDLRATLAGQACPECGKARPVKAGG
ncbi:MAG: hypothetical protein HEQ23_07185 [Tepidisphaera sp.]